MPATISGSSPEMAVTLDGAYALNGTRARIFKRNAAEFAFGPVVVRPGPSLRARPALRYRANRGRTHTAKLWLALYCESTAPVSRPYCRGRSGSPRRQGMLGSGDHANAGTKASFICGLASQHRLKGIAARLRLDVAAVTSPPPCGEGSGAGVGRCGTSMPHGTTPPPHPSPTRREGPNLVARFSQSERVEAP
jgi:hypothetical protein